MSDIITKISHTEICSTYNSYIIESKKNAVIDVVPSWDNKVKCADYIVFTHTEPRCADALEAILDANKNVVVVGTTATIRNYKEILNRDFEEYVVKNGEELDLGGAVLQFFVAPNINQPDTMLVFEKQSKKLFSGLLFSSYDTVDGAEWYYSDNLSMYGNYVDKAADIAAGLIPEEICPFIGDVRGAEECAVRYAKEKSDKPTAAVYYSSIYGYTRLMANALADGLRESGIKTELFDAESDDWEDMLDALDADILMFGTSTVHRNAAQSIWRLISHIDAVNAAEKTAAVFGSYGWSGEGVKIIEKLLESLKVKVYGTAQTAVYKPMEGQLDEMRKFAGKLACDVMKKRG